MYYQEHFNLIISLENVLKMSWRCFQNVLKTPWRRLGDLLETSWRRFQNILKKSWRCLKDVLKTYDQEEYVDLDQDVFWRRMSKANTFVLIKTSWRRLEDVFWRRLSLSILKSLLISSLDLNNCFPWSWITFIYFLSRSSIAFAFFFKIFS